MAGFIFGGDTGMSYEALQRKRKITDALMQQKSKPMDVANGLAQGLSSVAGALLGKKLDKREDQMRSDRQGEFTDLFGGGATPVSYGTPGGGDTGDMVAYRDAIASIESAGSGDYNAVGPTNKKLGRALGRYQIMEANIGPWSREALGKEVSADEFLANPKLQDAIFDHKFGGYVNKFGPEGAAQAWFAGPGGVGKTDRKDVLGTSVGQYGQKFSKALGGASSGSGGQSRSPADLAQLAQFAADPLLDPAQRKMAEIMLQRQMQQGEPMTQLDMQYKQAQLGQLRNPAPDHPASVQEYEYAKQNGYQGGYQDWVTQKAQSGATNISNVVNSGDPIDARPMADKPDKGYQRRWDEEQKTWVDEAIPGSSSQVDIATQDAKKAERERQKAIGLGPTLTNIQMNIDEIQDGGLPVTGAVGAGLGKIPGTSASDWRVRNEQITTEAALNEVQNMRDNSPTGGAVGQLTDSERQALAVAASGLSDAQSKDEYVRAAQTYRKTMLDLAYGEGSWTLDDKGDLSFGGAEPDAPPAADVDFSSDAAPQGLKLSESDADLWTYATPEERQAMWGK